MVGQKLWFSTNQLDTPISNPPYPAQKYPVNVLSFLCHTVHLRTFLCLLKYSNINIGHWHGGESFFTWYLQEISQSNNDTNSNKRPHKWIYKKIVFHYFFGLLILLFAFVQEQISVQWLIKNFKIHQQFAWREKLDKINALKCNLAV